VEIRLANISIILAFVPNFVRMSASIVNWQVSYVTNSAQ
jgi:hypothetical protein